MKIAIYTITDCKFSQQEKDYLNSHNLQFEERNLEQNRQWLTEMLNISNNFAGTPVTKIEKDDGKNVVLKGFTKEEFDEAFGFKEQAATGAGTAEKDAKKPEAQQPPTQTTNIEINQTLPQKPEPSQPQNTPSPTPPAPTLPNVANTPNIADLPSGQNPQAEPVTSLPDIQSSAAQENQSNPQVTDAALDQILQNLQSQSSNSPTESPSGTTGPSSQPPTNPTIPNPDFGNT